MRKFTLLSLSLFMWFGLLAQSYQGAQADKIIPGSQWIRMNQQSNLPDFIEFRKGSELNSNSLKPWLIKIYHLAENCNFEEVSRQTDALGFTHIRYFQTVNGITVHNAMFLVHQKGNKVYSINGIIDPAAATATTATITEAQALNYALTKVNAKVYKWELPTEENWIKEIEDNSSATFYPKGTLEIIKNKVSNQYRLAYKFDIYAHEPMSRANYYVDAQNGSILFINNKIHHSDSLGSAITKFSGTKPITTDLHNNTFRLRESGRGNGVETYDLNNGTSYGAAVDFIDSNNVWNNVNASQDEVAGDAHWGMEMTYDYYLNKYNRNSIDDNGYKLRGYIHFKTNYVNAYWNGQVMTFGDGNSSISPLVALDIVGHEITHGLTSNTADLDYHDESGAMNEAYSDIFGTAIEHFGKTGNWTIGEDIGITMRSMSNPKSKGDPDTYHGSNYYIGSQDNGGVHTNSGVLNHWFYLTSEGGTGVNDNGDSFTVNGVGIDTAAAVAFRTLTVYLTNTSQYADARFYSIKSAIDLYGNCSAAVEATTNAFYAVGIGGEYIDSVTANFTTDITDFCAPPANIKFTNTSSNGINYLWKFGDGSTSTQFEPTHIYNNYSNYTVQLFVDGGTCGSDSISKSEYISVDTANPCTVYMPNYGSQTRYECTGVLYDEGGNSNYSNNTYVTTTIAPMNAASITLNFSMFDFEQGYDFLKIYNGSSTASSLIGSYSGTSLPNGGSVTANSGVMTIVQSTDAGVVGAGFIASWQCTMPTVPPSISFTADDTANCSGTIGFSDNSLYGPTSWLWDFGDGTTSTLENPVHTYATNGTFTVKLTGTNSYGSNTLIKTSYITVNKPYVPYAPNKSLCSPGSIQLKANGNGVIKWYASQNSTTVLSIGKTFTTPSLSQSTSYWLENVIIKPTVSGGKPNKIGAGGNLNNKQSLIFDAYRSFILDSVTVYANSAGTRNITLFSKAGTLLASKTINVVDGKATVYLGFNIPKGTDYALEGKNMFRNNGGVSYPYSIPGLLSINKSSAQANPTGYYYYFYDWKIREPECVSDRVEVHAYINNAAPTANFVLTNNDPYIDFTDQSTNQGASSWDFGDGKTSKLGAPTHLYLQNGTYTVTLNVDNGCGTDSKTKTITIGQATSINQANDKTDVKLYPNPTSGKFNIDLGLNSEYELLSIYDFMGKMVKQIKLDKTTQIIQMNMSELSSGMYLIRLSSQDKYEELKLIITARN